MCRAEMGPKSNGDTKAGGGEGGKQQDMKGWKVIGRGGKFKSDN